MKALKLFYYRFKVISSLQALELGLEFRYNIFGDLINHLNCRSIWVDSKGRTYRVRELIKHNWY
jgi:hypothetical protein